MILYDIVYFILRTILNYFNQWMILILDPSESGRIKVIPKMDGQENMKVAGQILKLNKRDHKLPVGQ